MAARNAGRFEEKFCIICWMFWKKSWKNLDSCWMKFCHQSPGPFCVALDARLLIWPPGFTMAGAAMVCGAAARAEPDTPW
ncbi:hypothetical protein MYSE111917_27100 [Mycobacterium senriense]